MTDLARLQSAYGNVFGQTAFTAKSGSTARIFAVMRQSATRPTAAILFHEQSDWAQVHALENLYSDPTAVGERIAAIVLKGRL